MKVTVRLALDRLVGALRRKAHQLADEIESGYVRGGERVASGEDRRAMRAEDDDIGGA